MRWNRRCVWGCGEIIAGCIILMALVLPSGFWWFLLGAGLIGCGLWSVRCGL